MNAREIIDALGLEPHPEGGRFAETWRAETSEGTRSHGTAIYYLLKFGERSHWHRIDAAEIWHYYAGAPLRLSISKDEKHTDHLTLGPNIAAGERPQLIVAPNAWQAAESLGPWTLVGCTVSPGFTFDTFEMADEGWAPGG
ncbi:MAG: cupin domain-containing protein [Pseudomonadota bacterium]